MRDATGIHDDGRKDGFCLIKGAGVNPPPNKRVCRIYGRVGWGRYLLRVSLRIGLSSSTTYSPMYAPFDRAANA